GKLGYHPNSSWNTPPSGLLATAGPFSSCNRDETFAPACAGQPSPTPIVERTRNGSRTAKGRLCLVWLIHPPFLLLREPVAGPVHRPDASVRKSGSLQLSAQPGNMDIHRPLVDDNVVAPHDIEQVLPPEYPARLQRKRHQQAKFLWSKLELDTVDRRSPSVRLDLQVAPVENPRWPRRRHSPTTNRRTNSCQQLPQREWLDNVIVGTQFEAVDLVLLLAACRQHEDRNIMVLANMTEHLEPVELRKHHVEDDQVEFIPARVHQFDGRLAVVRRDDSIPFPAKVESQRTSQRRVILNQEDRGIFTDWPLRRTHRVSSPHAYRPGTAPGPLAS